MRQLYVLEEIIAMLQVVKTPQRFIDAFKQQAEAVHRHKNRREVDNVAVSSGYGKQAHVELTLNDQLTQMDVKKAKEIGLMLIEAAEAATSDEILMRLLERLGLPEEGKGPMLMELREIRQGTRDISRPN